MDVPEYTQIKQLRTLIFECPENKNFLNREKCNETCLTLVKSLYTNWWIPIIGSIPIRQYFWTKTIGLWLFFTFVLEAIKSMFRFKKCRRSHHLVLVFFLTNGRGIPPPMPTPCVLWIYPQASPWLLEVSTTTLSPSFWHLKSVHITEAKYLLLEVSTNTLSPWISHKDVSTHHWGQISTARGQY